MNLPRLRQYLMGYLNALNSCAELLNINSPDDGEPGTLRNAREGVAGTQTQTMKGRVTMFWLYLCFFALVIAAVAFMVCSIRTESFLDMACFIACLFIALDIALKGGMFHVHF